MEIYSKLFLSLFPSVCRYTHFQLHQRLFKCIHPPQYENIQLTMHHYYHFAIIVDEDHYYFIITFDLKFFDNSSDWIVTIWIVLFRVFVCIPCSLINWDLSVFVLFVFWCLFFASLLQVLFLVPCLLIMLIIFLAYNLIY